MDIRIEEGEIVHEMDLRGNESNFTEKLIFFYVTTPPKPHMYHAPTPSIVMKITSGTTYPTPSIVMKITSGTSWDMRCNKT
jgi:hypothetical protein